MTANQESIILLDGGTGRELEKQGASIDPPLWSANAFYSNPDIVKEVHKSFINAGASVITTNTYALTRYHLSNAEKQGDQVALLDMAYSQARQARAETHDGVRIAASIPPLSESYRADLVPDNTALEKEYELLIDRAIHNQADILLGETLSHAREARMIAKIAQKTTIPLWISFTVNESGNLRSGESLEETATELLDLGVKVLLANCSTMQNIHKSMSIYQALATAFDFQYGAYGNRYNEIREDYKLELKSTELKEDLSPALYTDAARLWVEKGATIVGGCCGIGPDYIRHISQNLPV
ncbi:homocysteine S-methyltransferase family protein [Salidesulfovibrio brasiliensis]|uniref:homocysteine S-methyltransferase family protein n=1 Tax=Salidesulfovibrio brasiliensis TaxID=221711 RepID=UPI0006D1CC8E|nr:homocysteine S-methyltransferase family protein [Salidesulfovibrio brasiliensis]